MKYGAGALASIAVTAGVMLILFGAGAISFNLLILAGAVLTVFGIYTIVFGALSREKPFYIAWGVISAVAGVTVAASDLFNPLLGLGLVLLFIGILAALLAAAREGGKER